MGLFGKPTLAQIYVKELRTRLDGTLVPLFSPDTNITVGTIGSFDKGQFVTSGVTVADEFGVTIPTREDPDPADWAYASENAVELKPEGTISVGGVELLKGKLAFRRDRAVVASFKSMKDTTAVWTSDLNRQVWEWYLTEQLPRTSVVVWSIRRAETATVVVSRKGGVSVELAADPKLLGGLLSIQGLGAGVSFTGGTQASIQLSGPGMTPFMRVKGVGGERLDQLVDVKSFEADPAATIDGLAEVDIPDLDVDAVEGQADWDEPEDEDPE